VTGERGEPTVTRPRVYRYNNGCAREGFLIVGIVVGGGGGGCDEARNSETSRLSGERRAG